MVRATPPGTGKANPFIVDGQRPILWRAWVAPGRRNARKGVGRRSVNQMQANRLEVRANPMGQPCFRNKTRQVEVREGVQRANEHSVSRWLPPRRRTRDFDCGCKTGCDALRCSGPHTRDTDGGSECITLAERPG